MSVRSDRQTRLAGFALIALGVMIVGADTPSPNPTAMERYGLGGFVKPIGIHHGFHVQTVAIDAPADRDGFQVDDVITKVDGSPIRSLDHLRAVLAEAYMEDASVAITYTRGTSIEPRVVTCKLTLDPIVPVARRTRRPSPTSRR